MSASGVSCDQSPERTRWVSSIGFAGQLFCRAAQLEIRRGRPTMVNCSSWIRTR